MNSPADRSVSRWAGPSTTPPTRSGDCCSTSWRWSRSRVRPDPVPHPRRHEGRPGQRSAPRQAAQAQPPPESTPGVAGAQRRVQHRRAVRGWPLHHTGPSNASALLPRPASRRRDRHAEPTRRRPSRISHPTGTPAPRCLIAALVPSCGSADSGGRRNTRGRAAARWCERSDRSVGGGRWYGPACPRVKGAARPFGTGCGRPLTRGTLRPWQGRTAGRAVALPASRARRLMLPRGAGSLR